MEATLEGEDVNVHIRSNKLDNETITWPESLADDYLHCLNDIEFEHICFYEQTSHYKKTFNANKITGVNSNEGSNYKDIGVKKYKFNESHPGYKFSYLTELKHHTIPRIALPRDKLCALDKLQLNAKNSTEESIDKCKMSAKMALLMFYPFCQLI